MSNPGGLKVFNTFSSLNVFIRSGLYRVKWVATDLYWSISMVFSNSLYTTFLIVSVNSLMKCTLSKLCQFFSNSHNLHPLPNQVTNQSRRRYIPFYTPYLYGSTHPYTWIPCQRRESCSKSYSLLSPKVVCSIDATVLTKSMTIHFGI